MRQMRGMMPVRVRGYCSRNTHLRCALGFGWVREVF
jgi:hypothetical protein